MDLIEKSNMRLATINNKNFFLSGLADGYQKWADYILSELHE
jgi:hypothetical protein